jgi:PAS domain S-box-containing protein
MIPDLRSVVPVERARELSREGTDSPWIKGLQGSPLVDTVLQFLLANVTLVVWTTDCDGVFTYSDGKGLANLGLIPGEVVGQSLRTMYASYPEVIDQFQRSLDGVASTQVLAIEGMVFETWQTPMRDSGGEIVGVLGVAADVTAAHSAEKARIEASMLFRQAFEASSAGYVLTDLNSGEFIDVNPAYLRMVNATRDQIIGRTTIDIGVWDDSFDRKEFVDAIQRDGRYDLRPSRTKTLDGKPRLMRGTIEAVSFGNRKCLLTILQDMTELKSRSVKLRRAKDEFEAITKVAQFPVFQFTEDHQIACANRWFKRLTRHGRGEIWLDALAEVVPEEIQQQLASDWSSDKLHLAPYEIDFQDRTDLSNERWWLLRIERKRSRRATRPAYVAVLVDITERKAAEVALKLANERLEQRVIERTLELRETNQVLSEQVKRYEKSQAELAESTGLWKSLVDNAPDFILFLDREGKVQFINHFRPDLPPEVVLGQPVHLLMQADYHPAVDNVLYRVFQNGEQVDFTAPSDAPNQHVLWYSSKVGPIRVNGQVVGATVVARDVTKERAAAENAEARQHELAHVSRLSTMGEMAAILAHEINQPLAAISNYAEGCIFRLKADPPDLGMAESALNEIVSQAALAGQIIHGTRQFLRRRPRTIANYQVGYLVQEAWEIAKLEARRKGGQLKLELPDNLPSVNVDDVQIIQVFVNLFLNAVDAMNRPEIKPRLIEVSALMTDSSGPAQHIDEVVIPYPPMGLESVVNQGDPDKGFVCIRVRDGGVGLPPQLGASVFDSFVSTKPEGLGMGLTITAGIVHVHGGKIWAETNKPEQGVTFSFTLPVSSSKVHGRMLSDTAAQQKLVGYS